MTNRRVVITGLGVVAPNGTGVDHFWQANIDGKSGIDLITTFDTSRYKSKIAGQVKDFKPLDYIPPEVVKRTDRFVHLGLTSSVMAIADSKIDLDKEDKTRIGVVFGSGLGGILFHEEQILAGYEKGTHRLNPLCVPKITPNAVASQIAIRFGLLGVNITISNACASGTNAIGEALNKIQNNKADIIVAGGCEAPLTEFTFGAYDAMMVLSKRNDAPQAASSPFDKRRDGFVLAEGGATLILEELGHALKRNATIYAELTGYATNSGAHHMVIPKPDAEDVARVMAQTVEDAGLKPEQIDYINAHGTSTDQNDKAETKAIKYVFKDYAYKLPISSTKSMIGHSIGAAGAIEAVVSCLTIKHQIIPPTINYAEKDPDCDLDYVPNKARKTKIQNVLSNSFGFGSNNACLTFGRYNG
jgi:3-oxoacyl-[acyl-carrier-protein] synthase II